MLAIRSVVTVLKTSMSRSKMSSGSRSPAIFAPKNVDEPLSKPAALQIALLVPENHTKDTLSVESALCWTQKNNLTSHCRGRGSIPSRSSVYSSTLLLAVMVVWDDLLSTKTIARVFPPLPTSQSVTSSNGLSCNWEYQHSKITPG